MLSSRNKNAENKFYASQNPIEYGREWGIKWYIVDKELDKSANLDKVLTFKHEDQYRKVYSDLQANPLFFWNSDKTNTNISYKMTTNTINLDVNNNRDDQLYINFIYNPYFRLLII